MKKFTYCSFAEPGKFLGALFLPGNLGAIEASDLAWKMKLNPGGEMACYVTEPISEREEAIVELYVGRLLSKADVEEFDRVMESDFDPTTGS